MPGRPVRAGERRYQPLCAFMLSVRRQLLHVGHDEQQGYQEMCFRTKLRFGVRVSGREQRHAVCEHVREFWCVSRVLQRLGEEMR